MTSLPAANGMRWVKPSIATVEHKANDLLAQADFYRELSSSLAYSDTADH